MTKKIKLDLFKLKKKKTSKKFINFLNLKLENGLILI